MITFDTNLIRYKKLFDVPKILAIYQDCQKFNYLMPKGYHQFKLFQMNLNFFGILLGINKQHIIKHEKQDQYFYNMIFMHYQNLSNSKPDKAEFYQFISSIHPLTKKLKKLDLLYIMPISCLKKEYIEENKLTEEKFLNDFSTSIFYPVIDLN